MDIIGSRVGQIHLVFFLHRMAVQNVQYNNREKTQKNERKLARPITAKHKRMAKITLQVQMGTEYPIYGKSRGKRGRQDHQNHQEDGQKQGKNWPENSAPKNAGRGH